MAKMAKVAKMAKSAKIAETERVRFLRTSSFLLVFEKTDGFFEEKF